MLGQPQDLPFSIVSVLKYIELSIVVKKCSMMPCSCTPPGLQVIKSSVEEVMLLCKDVGCSTIYNSVFAPYNGIIFPRL